eukprot:403342134
MIFLLQLLYSISHLPVACFKELVGSQCYSRAETKVQKVQNYQDLLQSYEVSASLQPVVQLVFFFVYLLSQMQQKANSQKQFKMESSGTQIHHIEEDLKELHNLFEQATRENSKQVLHHEIERLNKQKLFVSKNTKVINSCGQLEQAQPLLLEKKEDKSSKAQNDGNSDMFKKEQLIYTQLPSYGWEQDQSTVRVYMTSGLDGIGKHPKQNIDCEFTDNSLDLRVLDFNGKNYRQKIAPLNNLIDPAASKMKVKSNIIVLELRKHTIGKHWDDVKEKKSTLGGQDKKKRPEEDSNPLGAGGEDPQASLMNMMKKMYEEGDENMKRTIAESWTKAQSDKQGAGGSGMQF